MMILTNVMSYPDLLTLGTRLMTLANHNANKTMDQSVLEASARRLPSAGKDYISQLQVTVDFVVSTRLV